MTDDTSKLPVGVEEPEEGSPKEGTQRLPELSGEISSAFGFTVDDQPKVPAFRDSQTVSGEAGGCHSGLRTLFTQELGIEATKMTTKIKSINLFPCQHLANLLPSKVKKVENNFFRSHNDSLGYVKSVKDMEHVIVDITRRPGGSTEACAFIKGGPRRFLAWNPSDVVPAIVTCGGLCPGLNSVIKTLVDTLYYNYSVDSILGIRNGLMGFYTEELLPPMKLTPEVVETVTDQGGTMLGSSRGGYDIEQILASIEKYGINHLYIVGGDGTHRAAYGISTACKERGIAICVAGIPKTIDNDIAIVDRSFGFMTALDEAARAVRAARTEAKAYPRCIGMIKVMGRSAGFLAAFTTLSTECVDVCLLPELPVKMECVLETLHMALENDGYAIMVVAEGAGQELCETGEFDKSGNKVLGKIEEVLKAEIKKHFNKIGYSYNMKYIDPSYMIRSVRANAYDQLLCTSISQDAVHGAMAGFTDFSAGWVNNTSCMIPLQIIFNCSPCTIDPNGRTIERLRIATQGRKREAATLLSGIRRQGELQFSDMKINSIRAAPKNPRSKTMI